MSDETTSIDVFQHRHIKSVRDQLLESAVTYVLTGQDGTDKDRLRTASDLSGIPISQIELELEKRR